MLAAVLKGDAKELAELMRQDPGFNVNMTLEGSMRTLLQYACQVDGRSAVIPLLLAHPDINVNLEDDAGNTPFMLACYNGNISCVREMLKDSRFKVNEPTNLGRTPLWWAARWGYLDVIKWWIASGREMDLGKAEDFKKDAIGAAKRKGKSEVAILLERFKSDANQTRHVIRVELGFLDDLAAEMFAMVVFVSDGLLQINDTTPSPAAKFLSIAA